MSLQERFRLVPFTPNTFSDNDPVSGHPRVTLKNPNYLLFVHSAPLSPIISAPKHISSGSPEISAH